MTKYIVKLKIKDNLDGEGSFYKSFGLNLKYKEKGFGFLYTSIPLFYHVDDNLSLFYDTDKRTFKQRVEDSINEFHNMTDEELIDMIKDKIIEHEGIIQTEIDKGNKDKALVNKLNTKIEKLKKFEIEI